MSAAAPALPGLDQLDAGLLELVRATAEAQAGEADGAWFVSRDEAERLLAGATAGAVPALDELARRFGLSDVEQRLVIALTARR